VGRKRSKKEDERYGRTPGRMTFEQTLHDCPTCGTRVLNTRYDPAELVAHKTPAGQPCNY
jgi:hypothetical protein